MKRWTTALLTAAATCISVSAPVRAKPDTGPLLHATLIDITYPAVVTDRARSRLEEELKTVYFSGAGSHCSIGCAGMAALGSSPAGDTPPEIIFKSSFWVHELFRELSGRFPSGSVELLPGTVDVDASGELTYSLPQPSSVAPLLVDFAAFVSPRFDSEYGNPIGVSTRGRKVAGLFLVSRRAVCGPAKYIPVAASKGLHATITGVPPSIMLTATGHQQGSPSAQLSSLAVRQYKLTEQEWQSLQSNDRVSTGAVPSIFKDVSNALAIQIEAQKGLAQEQQRCYSDALDPRHEVASQDLIPKLLAAEADFRFKASSILAASSSSREIDAAVLTILDQEEKTQTTTAANSLGYALTRIGQTATHMSDPGVGFASLQALNDRSQSLGKVIETGQGARTAAADKLIQVQLDQVKGFANLQASTVAELRDKLGSIYRMRKGAANTP